jgi:hypothetical protein
LADPALRLDFVSAVAWREIKCTNLLTAEWDGRGHSYISRLGIRRNVSSFGKHAVPSGKDNYGKNTKLEKADQKSPVKIS